MYAKLKASNYSENGNSEYKVMIPEHKVKLTMYLSGELSRTTPFFLVHSGCVGSFHFSISSFLSPGLKLTFTNMESDP